MEWQDISTAPRDGTEFLCYDDGEPFIAWWYEPSKAFAWAVPHILVGESAYVNPTHWMPLPPPPQD